MIRKQTELFRKDFLICPQCHGKNLEINDRNIMCLSCKSIYKIINGIPIFLKKVSENKIYLTKARWNKHWKEYSNQKNQRNEWFKKYVKITFDKHIGRYIRTREIFLEIGSGPGRIALEACKRGSEVIALDFCLQPLLILKEELEKLGLAATLICADIRNMPIRDELVNFSYGGGVIEHFRNTNPVIAEIYRITKPGGYAFNFVPAIGLAFIYAQLWGTIPEISFLKEFFELIHIRILKGKHMKFGYEKAFTERKLKKIFGRYFQASKLETGVFLFPSEIGLLKSDKAKNFVRSQLRHRLFAHKIFINAKK